MKPGAPGSVPLLNHWGGREMSGNIDASPTILLQTSEAIALVAHHALIASSCIHPARAARLGGSRESAAES